MDKLFQTFTAVKEAYDLNRLSESASSQASEPEEEEKEEEVEIAIIPSDVEEKSVPLESKSDEPSSEDSNNQEAQVQDDSSSLLADLIKPIIKSSQDKIEAVSPLEKSEDDVEVRKEFYDHSFWNANPNLDINDLLADYL